MNICLPSTVYSTRTVEPKSEGISTQKHFRLVERNCDKNTFPESCQSLTIHRDDLFGFLTGTSGSRRSVQGVRDFLVTSSCIVLDHFAGMHNVRSNCRSDSSSALFRLLDKRPFILHGSFCLVQSFVHLLIRRIRGLTGLVDRCLGRVLALVIRGLLGVFPLLAGSVFYFLDFLPGILGCFFPRISWRHRRHSER